MKRDMDLVRAILLHLEAEAGPSGISLSEVEGHTWEETSYHVDIMAEAGLVNGEGYRSSSTGACKGWMNLTLTWAGHEFLDAAREPSRWESAQTVTKQKAGTVSFEVLKQVLVSLAIKALGL
jgi:hypothetical protein